MATRELALPFLLLTTASCSAVPGPKAVAIAPKETCALRNGVEVQVPVADGFRLMGIGSLCHLIEGEGSPKESAMVITILGFDRSDDNGPPNAKLLTEPDGARKWGEARLGDSAAFLSDEPLTLLSQETKLYHLSGTVASYGEPRWVSVISAPLEGHDVGILAKVAVGDEDRRALAKTIIAGITAK